MSAFLTQHAFNKAASTYDQYCYLQNKVGKHLCELIQSKDFKINHIIDLGCGTGQTTEVLANTQNFNSFVAVDFASRLIKIADERLHSRGIATLHADFMNLPAFSQSFDLAFSNLALHWSHSLERLLTIINQLLSHHGLLAFSIPLPGTLRELKPFFTINSFYNTHQIDRLLQSAGYEPIMTHKESITLKFQNTISALQSIKLVGANNTHQKLNGGLRGKSAITKFPIETLTYEIGYFISRKRDEACQLNTLLPEQTPVSEKPRLPSNY